MKLWKKAPIIHNKQYVAPYFYKLADNVALLLYRHVQGCVWGEVYDSCRNLPKNRSSTPKKKTTLYPSGWPKNCEICFVSHKLAKRSTPILTDAIKLDDSLRLLSKLCP